MYRAINCTIITLVPKTSSPKTIKEFRPIAYCTVLYKIISKFPAARLQAVIPIVINEAKDGFIPGRRIADNIILAHELVKAYSRKHISPRCTIKLDLQKAYEFVEWLYIRQVMEEMGFPQLFFSWIMECIQTVNYSIIVSREPTTPFNAAKGLRQGDPISPFLFAIVMEFLSKNLNYLKEVSRLQANMNKNEVYFGGVPTVHKQQILQHLGFTAGELSFKYLGVPLSTKKLNGQKFTNWTIPQQACWMVRKVFEANEVLENQQYMQSHKKSLIRQIYLTLIGDYSRVEWKGLLFSNAERPKAKFSMWLMMHEKLLISDRLYKWGLNLDTQCVLCQRQEENREHLFTKCEYTKKVFETNYFNGCKFNALEPEIRQQHNQWIITCSKRKSQQAQVFKMENTPEFSKQHTNLQDGPITAAVEEREMKVTVERELASQAEKEDMEALLGTYVTSFLSCIDIGLSKLWLKVLMSALTSHHRHNYENIWIMQ
ncbi:uncharacterized protein [Nicotiana sylvestris]|uniref:uncharacterized protein n=1 Tax=Nicotiana sylvestris TaxID=4096 RepID=UPI00388CC7AC